MKRTRWNNHWIMQRILAAITLLVITATLQSHAQGLWPLRAPTFYIVAGGDYSKYSAFVTVKGASNLPAGSRIAVSLSDYVGFRSSILSETAEIVLDKTGFFEVTLKPLNGKRFKDNMVCDLTLMPSSQSGAVQKVVGKKGELLGIDSNPQVGKNSGEYYLEALVHIP
jgi:hypothetical protein